MSKNKRQVNINKPDNLKKKNHNINYEYLLLGLILLITIIAFIHSIKNGFIFWDDDKLITDNPYIKRLSFSNIAYNFKNESFTFIPLLTWTIDYLFWGLNPTPFHVSNLIFHLTNVCLVYYLIKLISKRYEVALIVCLMFAIHPMRVESVAWLSERKDLLFTLFFLIALIFYYFYINKGYKIKYLILTMLFGYLSTLSKIQGLALPAILFLMDYFYKRPFSLKVMLEKFVLVIVLFPLVIVNILYFIIPYITAKIVSLYYFFINLFTLTENFMLEILFEIKGFYYLGIFDKLYAPAILIMFVVLAFYILYLLKFNLFKKLKENVQLNHIIIPLSIVFIFQSVLNQEIIYIASFLLMLTYFIYNDFYKSIFNVSEHIISIVIFIIAIIITILNNNISTYQNILIILSAVLVLYTLLNYSKKYILKTGYISNYLLAFFILTLSFRIPYLAIIGIWLIIGNNKYVKLYYLNYVFVLASLIFIQHFNDRLLLFTPFILWYAIDYYYNQIKQSLFDFWIYKLTLFIIFLTLVIEQSINPLYEYTALTAFYIFYIYIRDNINSLFKANIKASKEEIKREYVKETKQLLQNSYKTSLSYLKNITIVLFKFILNSKILKYVFFAILFILLVIIGKYTMILWRESDVQEYTFSFFDRIFLASYSFIFYLISFIFPFDLTAIHIYPIKKDSMLPLEYYFSLVALLLLIAFVIYIIKRYAKYKREIIFGSLFFLFNISMVMHIIPIHGRVVVADRYTYLAYLGLFFIYGYSYIWIKESNFISKKTKQLLYYIFIAYIGGYFIYTFNRNKVWKDSIVLFDSVINKDPNLSLAYNNRGWSKFNMRDLDGALLDFDKAILIDSNYAGAFLNRGWLKYNRGDLKGSLIDYNKALEIEPEFSFALTNRGKAKIDLGDNEGALEDFNKSIELNPVNSIAYSNRAKIKIDKKDYKGAIIDLNIALKFNPDLALGYYNRGVANENLDNLKDAFEDYSEAIRCDSTFALGYNNRGFVKFKLQDNKGALSDYNNAVRLNPNYPLAYNNRAYIKLQLSDYVGAVNDYMISLQFNPNNPYSYNFMGLAKSKLLDYKGAIEDFNKALSIASNFPDAYNNRGWTYFNMNKINEAINDYRIAIQLDNKSLTAYENLASAYYSLNNFQEAIKYYSIAIQLSESNKYTYFYRAMSYYNLKNFDNACKDWKKANELGSTEAIEYINKYCK